MINLDALSDCELVLLVQQDNSDAFAKIYQKYWPELYNSAYKRNNNREQCEDIVQNVFTDFWNRRKVLIIENLPAFLYTAVRFQVLRQASRWPLQAAFLDHFEEIITSPEHTDDQMLEKEILALIQLWIAALPSKRRKIFLMHYTENLSTKEISAHLGISQKTVQNQLNNASQELRLRLTHFLSLSALIGFILR